ncbi:MAG: VOC family protein [Planktomarina sp.]
MAHGEFGWCELLHYNQETVQNFYGHIMGWQFWDADDVPSTRVRIQASVTKMPATFVDLQMPSFWMSHIEVDDVEATCAVAAAHGGKVEMVERGEGSESGFALICDPSGAGFTVFAGVEGVALSRRTFHRCGHILYTDDPSLVAEFYQNVFGWDLSPSPEGYHVQAGTQRIEISNAVPELRGGHSFWSVMFALPTMDYLPDGILGTGGRIIRKAKTRYGHSAWIMDPEGAVVGFVEKPMLGGWQDWASAMF